MEKEMIGLINFTIGFILGLLAFYFGYRTGEKKGYLMARSKVEIHQAEVPDVSGDIDVEIE